MSRFLLLPLLVLGCLSLLPAQKQEKRAGLKAAWTKLPLGAVRPEGWLKDQLLAQRQGLTGYLDEFWPDLIQSAWRGREGEAWERGPYYLDGLIPLAYILQDEALIAKVNAWMEPLLQSSQPNGWFGPAKNTDRWPLAVACKVLMQYYEATRDNRALDVLKRYFQYLHDSPPDWPDETWRGVRAMEHAVTGYWLYRQTGDPRILETIRSIFGHSYDWTSYFIDFPWDSVALRQGRIPRNWKADGLTAHVVNVAMAVKYPGLWYQQSGNSRAKRAVYDGIANLDAHHGQVGGRFSGDEHLSGRAPTQGTELCAVVEYMFSLEKLLEVFGDPDLADRLELLAYNALPGTMTPDCWAHQYDQQSNQVLVSRDKRTWSTNGDASNVYGLMPNFPCCLANYHQGWPKFVEHLWMETADGGLVATAYGPSRATTRIGEGAARVTIVEDTDYPFDGDIRFRIEGPSGLEFPIYLRIPAWAGGATLVYGDRIVRPRAGTMIKLTETWRDGDEIMLTLPMAVAAETRYNGAVALRRGPLYYSLRIGKSYERINFKEKPFYSIDTLGSVDWIIRPTTAWNYGLRIDPAEPGKDVTVYRHPLRALPFADRGEMVYDASSGAYRPWEQEAPVLLKLKGKKIPGWILNNNSAEFPPADLPPSKDEEEIILVPYGCTRLRVTEFPVVH